MVAANAAFLPATLQAVRIAIEGVTGTMMVHFLGTAEFYVLDYDGNGVILQIPNCLMNPGQHNLLSLAQLQMHPDIAVNMTNEAPAIHHDSGYVIPLVLDNGTFVLPFQVLDGGDPRRWEFAFGRSSVQFSSEGVNRFCTLPSLGQPKLLQWQRPLASRAAGRQERCAQGRQPG